MGKRMKKTISFLLIVVFAIAGACFFYEFYVPPRKIFEDSPQWLKESPPLIAHAAGGIWEEKEDGSDKLITYSNSAEALRQSLKNGYRMIEIDLALTTDGDFACTHAWPKSDTKYMSSSQWRSYRVKKKYTSMSLRAVLQILKNRPEVYLVTDNKSYHTAANTRKEFELLYQQAMAIGGEELLNRIIPQFYNMEMYDTIQEVYHWPYMIYTLYRQDSVSDQEVIDFIRDKEDIPIITMPTRRVSEEFCQALHDIGKYAYTHTVDDFDKLKEYRKMGIDGIYTNTILPGEYRKKYYGK